MQRSEHPSGLFAGLAETDPPFLWAGDSRNSFDRISRKSQSCSPVVAIPLTRPGTFRESHALGKRMTGLPKALPRCPQASLVVVNGYGILQKKLTRTGTTLTGTTNASRPAHTSSLLGDQADGR